MGSEVKVPTLGESVTEGTIERWLVKEGDKVASGDVIAEIETDKATMEVEAVDEGTVAKIVVAEGTSDVPVNDIIAVLAGEGEDASAAASAGAPGAGGKTGVAQGGGETGAAPAASSSAIRRGVNPRETSARMRVWRGGSIARKDCEASSNSCGTFSNSTP